VQAGTFLAAVGPNGAGKSTLVNLVAGLLTPDSGTIRVDGNDVRSYPAKERAQRIAVVRQEFVPVFGLSVAEAVLMARTAHYGATGFENKNDHRLATMAMELTDTARFASRPLGSLSGGERQRVFIARALAQDTSIVLMDEPTSFLDLKHQVATYDLLKTIQAERKRTIITVTHEINLAAQYCDEALLLRPAATGPCHCRIGSATEVFTAENIAEAFGVSIFSGRIGRENFFIPLGKMAKDRKLAGRPSRDPASTPDANIT
jgi:iron complex transport system ATP-binding protein